MQKHKEKRVLKIKSPKVSILITNLQLLITALALSGCMGVYEGGFECAPQKGVGCKSISEVNEMVNQHSGPSLQCSECKTMDIWYAPWFCNSQKSHSQYLNFQQIKDDRRRKKDDVSDSI
ncbi:MAG: hypothetical protein F9K49_04280 [Caedimonadaceae bacterium]|nr:MAG: hypothetical protein F9K49_04280 [Caedimonadaceae bacterium]